MVGILVMSHGPMAEGIVESAKLFQGEMEQLKTLCLKANDGVEDFDERMLTALRELDDGSGVVVLCDLYGGTPANRTVYALEAGHAMRVVTGMNLAMLLELIEMRDDVSCVDEMDFQELVDTAKGTVVYLNDEIDAAKAAQASAEPMKSDDSFFG